MEFVLYSCRRLWNHFLDQKIIAYKDDKKSISCYTQINEIPKLSSRDESLKEVYSQTLQDVPRRLEKAFQAFFRRCKTGEEPGFPRFKGKDRLNSFTYPQNNGSFKIDEKNGRIYLSKIGHVKIKYHRLAKGKWKTCVVKKSSTGKWHVVISTEIEFAKVKNDRPSVGIDLGLKEFAVLSDGSRIKRERFFKTEEKALAKSQRRLAKQARGTPERKKAKKVVARIHERIADRRSNFTHQNSRMIADKYGTICVENLDISGMMENKTITVNGKKLSAKPTHRSINDVAWNQFVNQLSYKAEEAGGLVIQGNPKGTTQKCSACGRVVPKDLGEREHKCSCGFETGRDFNSSLNILAVGLHSLDVRKTA